MIIGSHNTMTYLRPKKWWLLPFYWMARCQKHNYIEQYKKGVTVFDLRICFDKNLNIEFSHSFFRYNGKDFWNIIDFAKLNNIQIRLTLENCKNDLELTHFQVLCNLLEEKDIVCYGGWCRNKNWEVVYNFKYKQPDFLHWYSSKQDGILDNICPWLWWKFKGKKYQKFKPEAVLTDFI